MTRRPSISQVEHIVSRVCQRCGYVHGTDDARVVNRFSAGEKIFIAKHGNIQRFTRAEAEYDECTWRINKNAQTENGTEKISEIVVPENTIKHQPTEKIYQFPAAMIEVAAREKAWLDFLAHVNSSLLVWQIDDSIHSSIDSPIDWLRRCSKELFAILPAVAV